MPLMLGSLVSGGISGFKAGLDLQDAVKQRKLERATAKRVGEAQQEIKAHEGQWKTIQPIESSTILPGESAGMPDPKNQVASRAITMPNQQVAQVDNTKEPIALDDTQTDPNMLSNSIKPIGLAEGGMVDASTLGLDSASMASPAQAPMVNQALQPQQAPQQVAPQQAPQGLDATAAQKPQQAPTPQQRQAYYSRAAIDKKLYDGLTDDAVKYGDGKAAMQYFKASFDTSQKMIKDNLANAQREFEQFGDLSSFKDLYNHAYPDGRQVSDIQKDDKGNYLIQSQGTDGKVTNATYSLDQVKSMLMHFDDTEGLWKAQAASAAARQKEINARDDDILKEKSKGVTLAAGAKHFNSDGTTYDNPKDDSSVSETELAVKAAKGDQEAIKALSLIEDHKQKVAREGRAPAQPREKSFEAQAYEDWAQEPANKGKGKNQYLKEKANWKTNDGGLDSITESESKLDKYGNEVGKTSRTTHVPKVKPQTEAEKAHKVAYDGYISRLEKVKGNPQARKELEDIYRAKKVIK